MSTERGQGELVGLLREHRWRALEPWCSCGWHTTIGAPYNAYLSHLTAVLQAHVDAEVAAALEGAADNMPLRRPGQPYEHAAGWLRRRRDALYPQIPRLREQVPTPGGGAV